MGELMFGMACEFGLTRTVRDAAHLLDAVQGPGVGDKYTAPPPAGPYADEFSGEPGQLRVAVTSRAWSGAAVDPEVAAVAVQAGRMLESMGHAVTDASPHVEWDAVLQAVRTERAGIAASFLLAPTPPPAARLESVSRRVFAEAQEFSALDLIAGMNAQNRVTRSVAAFFTGHDLLVTPTLGQLPAPHGTLRYDDPDHTVTSWTKSIFDYGPFTAVFNVTGQPAISLPLGQSRSGLPIGVQIVASYGREDLLFQIAAQLERAMPWKDRTPRVFVGEL